MRGEEKETVKNREEKEWAGYCHGRTSLPFSFQHGTCFTQVIFLQELIFFDHTSLGPYFATSALTSRLVGLIQGWSYSVQIGLAKVCPLKSRNQLSAAKVEVNDKNFSDCKQMYPLSLSLPPLLWFTLFRPARCSISDQKIYIGTNVFCLNYQSCHRCSTRPASDTNVGVHPFCPLLPPIMAGSAKS